MKFLQRPALVHIVMSHPARGAWVEIGPWIWVQMRLMSHPARGAWVEI